MFSCLKRLSGSMYSARIRNGRASVLSRKSWSRYASGRCFAICEKLYHFHQFIQGAPMVHRTTATLAAVFAATLIVKGVAASTAAPQGKPPAAPAHEHKETGSGGWTLPADAETKKSPLTVDAKVLAAGKSVF